jgi:hypothetical protein
MFWLWLDACNVVALFAVPAFRPLLFGSVPGVMIGAQLGLRLVRFAVMKWAQPAVFMA